MTRRYLCLSGLLLLRMVTRDPRVRRILGRQFEGIIEKQCFLVVTARILERADSWKYVLAQLPQNLGPQQQRCRG